MYKPKHFVLKELVHPDLLKSVPESTLWAMFDDRLLRCADKIRELYGPCTVNASGLTDCGLRDINSKTGVKWSAHKLGRALDLHIRSIELEHAGNKKAKAAAYDRVRVNLCSKSDFDVLNFEQSISWLHIDTYNRNKRLFSV